MMTYGTTDIGSLHPKAPEAALTLAANSILEVAGRIRRSRRARHDMTRTLTARRNHYAGIDRVGESNPIPAAQHTRIEIRIGLFQQGLHAGRNSPRFSLESADSNADGYANGAYRRVDRRVRDRPPHNLCARVRIRQHGAFEYHGKDPFSQTSTPIGFASKASGYQSCELPEHEVRDRGSVGIVDRLQIVDLDQQQ